VLHERYSGAEGGRALPDDVALGGAHVHSGLGSARGHGDAEDEATARCGRRLQAERRVGSGPANRSDPLYEIPPLHEALGLPGGQEGAHQQRYQVESRDVVYDGPVVSVAS